MFIDSLPVEYLHDLMPFFFSDRVRVEPCNGEVFYQERKRVIITLSGIDNFELPNEAVYHRRFTVVKFPEASSIL